MQASDAIGSHRTLRRQQERPFVPRLGFFRPPSPTFRQQVFRGGSKGTNPLSRASMRTKDSRPSPCQPLEGTRQAHRRPAPAGDPAYFASISYDPRSAACSRSPRPLVLADNTVVVFARSRLPPGVHGCAEDEPLRGGHPRASHHLGPPGTNTAAARSQTPPVASWTLYPTMVSLRLGQARQILPGPKPRAHAPRPIAPPRPALALTEVTRRARDARASDTRCAPRLGVTEWDTGQAGTRAFRSPGAIATRAR